MIYLLDNRVKDEKNPYHIALKEIRENKIFSKSIITISICFNNNVTKPIKETEETNKHIKLHSKEKPYNVIIEEIILLKKEILWSKFLSFSHNFSHKSFISCEIIVL